jgi:hypothetical protein
MSSAVWSNWTINEAQSTQDQWSVYRAINNDGKWNYEQKKYSKQVFPEYAVRILLFHDIANGSRSHQLLSLLNTQLPEESTPRERENPSSNIRISTKTRGRSRMTMMAIHNLLRISPDNYETFSLPLPAVKLPVITPYANLYAEPSSNNPFLGPTNQSQGYSAPYSAPYTTPYGAPYLQRSTTTPPWRTPIFWQFPVRQSWPSNRTRASVDPRSFDWKL